MRKSASLVFAAAVGSLIGLMVFSKRQPSRAEAQQTQPTVPAKPGQPVIPVRGRRRRSSIWSSTRAPRW